MLLSEITSFLEMTYGFLNDTYFDSQLSRVVITVQSSPKAHGHYTKYNAWTERENGYREINISAETISRNIENVISTLLHEMVHHYCDLNNIQDCSRGGTYHNRRFKEQAEKRDLIIGYDNRIGYSLTSPSPSLVAFIEQMGWNNIDLSRMGNRSIEGSDGPDGPDTGKKKSSTRKYTCSSCGCSVRATKEVNIGCLDCGTIMALEEK